MALKLATTSSKWAFLFLGGFAGVCGASYSAWHFRPSVFSDQSVNSPANIPSSLRKIPIDRHTVAQPAPLSNSPVKYSLGDRLKVTLFENVDLSDEEHANLPATGLVERTELTGEYVVQENGYISLPLLGAVEVEGKSVEEVAESLQAAFKQWMARPAKASVVLMDREPIYLVGKGTKPGTFKYSPGNDSAACACLVWHRQG